LLQNAILDLLTFTLPDNFHNFNKHILNSHGLLPVSEASGYPAKNTAPANHTNSSNKTQMQLPFG